MNELLDIVFNDKTEITVEEAARTFGTVMMQCDKLLDSFKEVKQKISKEEWNKLMNSITFSYISSIYVNSHIDEEEQKRRIEVVSSIIKKMSEPIAKA